MLSVIILSAISGRIKWNSKPPSMPPCPPTPKSRMKPHKGKKHTIFSSLILGKRDLGFPFILSKTAIMDRIKWNSKPPSPRIKDEATQGETTRNFPIFDFGGRWGLGFPFILSKIVVLCHYLKAMILVGILAPQGLFIQHLCNLCWHDWFSFLASSIVKLWLLCLISKS